MIGAEVIAGRSPERRARVAVVVPFYEAERTMTRTLDSICRQTMTDWHAVLIDDGSTDGGSGIARAAVERDPRFMLVHKPHGGVSSARNAGLPFARGISLHHMDADDWLEPSAYATLIALAARRGEPAAMGSHAFAREDGAALDARLLSGAVVGWNDFVRDTPAWLPSMILDADAAGACRFDETIAGYEDLDLVLRLAETGVRWATTPEIVATYRVRAGSLSKRSGAMLVSAARVLRGARERRHRAGRTVPDAAIDRRLRALALDYATRHVLLGGGPEEAASILTEIEREPWIEPAAAARAVASGLLTACGLPPPLARARRGTWMPAVCGWWRYAARLGWARRDLDAVALAALADTLVGTDEICAELLSASGPAITIVGYGHNGSALARVAMGRGIDVVVRDDRFDGQPDRERAPLPAGARHEPMDSPVDPARHTIVTPLEDEELAARIGAHAVTDRWNAARERLVQRRPLTPN